MNARSFICLYNKKYMNMKQIISLGVLFASSVVASAAGYQVGEQGASNMGTALAGATVNANADATSAFWNASAVESIGLKVGETRADAAIFAIIPTLGLTFDDNAHAGYGGQKMDGDCSENAYIPQMFVVHRFTENIYGTLSITAPWGLASDYDKQWIGNTMGTHSYLFTTDINPSIAYKVNDWLTVAGGVSAQYGYCRLTSMLPMNMGRLKMSGDDWSVGGNIGFTIKYAEGGRIGFQWRSAVDYTLKGDVESPSPMAPDGLISAEMHMPHTFTIGIYQRLSGAFEEFAVMADYSYIMWSCFEDLTVKGALNTTESMDWENTSRVSAGIHYYPHFDEDLTLRFGVCYDESPVHSTASRTTRIPCFDRFWLSTGLGYQIGDFSFDLSYAYIFCFGNSGINRTSANAVVSGNYAAHIHVLGAQVGYKF